MTAEPIIIEGPDGPVTVHADPNATDSTPQLAGEWGPIPVVELTPEELVERYPRTRAEVDAALQVPPTPEEAAEWDQTFRDTATPKAKEAWDARLGEYFDLRKTSYLTGLQTGTRMSGKSEALRLIDEMRADPPRLTEQQVRDLQAANARQVHAEWVAAGRPGERPVVDGPLRIRIEPSPGFGKTWLSLLACCGYLRGVVDEKVFMGDLAP